MSWRIVVLFAVLAFLAGASLGRRLLPAEVREVVREVKVRDVVTVREEDKTITKRPDGTVVTEIKTRTDTRVEERKDRNVSPAPAKAQYSVGAYGTLHNVQVQLDRRLFGDLWAGVYVRANVETPLRAPEFGVGIRYEF
ncbi:hypothetical protein UFOVP1351_3 [uncultured Caudovirales phage]|uniref:Uncharacterized protein n=1 Tax=uncultured Caudovirales phage TaxID=2100421 RepID=A0A6J5RUM8_9CAUD|nr:hypothetical protein UFOVP1351_3 [uncultured Caudovirales phage]